ncbi:MFS transporter [Aequorivita sp. 609]|uniref:MFS transporter n=1 Tax=Aequorivita TaxID=153265 RepID=UPI00161CE621|nr:MULTISPECIES: MFS transporter [Aequorivita]MBB6682263.1 MFS transporter [Aequorivita sp. 609]
MERIRIQKHSIETLYYSISLILERASYYGLRLLIIIYMTGEVLKMNSTEALSIYGLFTGSLMLSKIIGAILGDLVIGNKKALFIGGMIQAIGAFCLCIPSTLGLYLGLFLIVIGNGFYTPNIISNFGKSYLNNKKQLDSGFSIFYLATNLGAFLGTLLIGLIGEKYGYNYAFIIGGLLMLSSLIPILRTKEKVVEKEFKHDLTIKKRILNISIVLMVVGLFWAIYEISYYRIIDLQVQFRDVITIEIFKNDWHSINSLLILPIGIIAIIGWTYFYTSQFFKLILGFIFGAISLIVLMSIPDVFTEKHMVLYLLSILFMGISEIHIAPILYSTLTKYSNPKYLAILISLAFIPTSMLIFSTRFFNDRFYDNPIFGLKLGVTIMIIVAIGLFGYIAWNKKTAKTLS